MSAPRARSRCRWACAPRSKRAWCAWWPPSRKVDPDPCLGMRTGDGEPMPLCPPTSCARSPTGADRCGAVRRCSRARPSMPAARPAPPSGSACRSRSSSAPPRSGRHAERCSTRSRQPPPKGATEVVLVARDTENWDAGKRDELTDQRIGGGHVRARQPGLAPGASASRGGPTRPTRRFIATGPACRRSPSCACRARGGVDRHARSARRTQPEGSNRHRVRHRTTTTTHHIARSISFAIKTVIRSNKEHS